MKKQIIISSLLFQSIVGFAQITDALGNQHILRADGEVEMMLKDKSIYSGKASKPTFIGGDAKLQEYLFKNLSYARSQSLATLVRFLVSDDGEVTIPFILKSSGDATFDADALRLVKEMPDWNPAVINDENKSCYHSIEVNFDPRSLVQKAAEKQKAIENPKPGKEGTGFIYNQEDIIEEGKNSKASFNGQQSDLYKWLSQNIKYPAVARENNIQGRVETRFVVEKDGSVTLIEVTKGVNKLLDEEAIRVISIMPAWIPAKINGQAVRSYYKLPLGFKLEGG